jgi:hypothetical protein
MDLSSIAIPVLPCVSVPKTLEFYKLLGFEVTQQQMRPNPYAATRRGDAHVHFMGIPGIEPENAFSTCLVIVPEVEALHQTFAAELKKAFGKLPLKGIPRITRMKPGQTRFTVVDVSGNFVIFIRRDEPDPDEGMDAPMSRLLRSTRQALRLRDFKNDDDAAAKVLDVALARKEDAPKADRVQALTIRLEIAVARRERARVKALRAELNRI